MDPKDTYRSVQDCYAGVASQIDDSREQGDYERKVAKAFGYDLEDLRSIPESANLGVSCGNPLAMANIREVGDVSGLLLGAEFNINLQGEVVIDFGSGGGIDVLLAAKKVGADGQAIGVDMTKDMLELARRNARKAGVSNASFIEAFITSIPLPSSTADCIISNCVVNLVPEVEKILVFQEMFRLLKPGGRVAISDILAKRELPIDIRKDLSLYVGCIAGASQVCHYEGYLKEAGFQDLLILDTHGDLNLYKEIWKRQEANELAPTDSCCDSIESSTSASRTGESPDVNFNFWTGSFKIFAIKPDVHG